MYLLIWTYLTLEWNDEFMSMVDILFSEGILLTSFFSILLTFFSYYTD